MITFLTLLCAALMGAVLGYIFGHNKGWELCRSTFEKIGDEMGVYKEYKG